MGSCCFGIYNSACASPPFRPRHRADSANPSAFRGIDLNQSAGAWVELPTKLIAAIERDGRRELEVARQHPRRASCGYRKAAGREGVDRSRRVAALARAQWANF